MVALARLQTTTQYCRTLNSKSRKHSPSDRYFWLIFFPTFFRAVILVPIFFFLQPRATPRLTLNEMFLDEVIEDSKLKSRTPHDLMFGGEKNIFVLETLLSFLFFFGLRVLRLRAQCVVLGRDHTFVLLRTVDDLPSFSFLVLHIRLADDTYFGVRRAASWKTCNNVGVLWSLALRSSVTTPSPSIRVFVTVFLCFTWYTGLQIGRFHLALLVFCCTTFSVRRGQLGCALCAAISSFRLRVESLFLVFVCSCSCLCASMVCSACMSSLLCYAELWLCHFCLVRYKPERVSCKTIASGNPWLSKYHIHVLDVHGRYGRSTLTTRSFSFVGHWFFRLDYCSVS